MAEQITWTHVDKMVRKMHDERGMLPIGLTDAEVTYNLIKYLQRNARILAVQKAQVETELVRTETRLRAVQDNPIKKSKTKQRLAKLEKEVERLSAIHPQVLEMPFTIGKCANKHCLDKAREISPYCEKCEPDL